MPQVMIIKRPRRNKLYAVWYERTPDGKRHSRWRALPTTDPEEAKKRAQEIEALIDNRQTEEQVFAVAKRIREELPQLARLEIAETWSAYLKQPSPRDVTDRTKQSKRLLVEAWMTWMAKNHPEAKYLHEVSDRLAAEYMGTLREKVAGQTYNNVQSALRSVCQLLRVPAGLKSNPFDAVPRVQAKAIRKEHLTVDQVRDLLKAADKTPGVVPGWWRAAILLGFYTGLRLRSVCILEASNLMPEDQTLFIRPDQHKTGRKSLLFPLPDEVWNALPHPTEGYLFPAVAKAYDNRSSWLIDEFNELLKAIGLEPTRAPAAGERRKRDVKQYGFHSLRHAFVTAALDAGVSLGDVQLTAGHGSPIMTQHYSHSLAAARRVLAKLPHLDI